MGVPRGRAVAEYTAVRAYANLSTAEGFGVGSTDVAASLPGEHGRKTRGRGGEKIREAGKGTK